MPGTNPETALARTTVVSLALQALVHKLVASGALTMDDLVEMRAVGLQLAADLREHGGTGAQIGGARLEVEIMAWWDHVNTPALHANDP